MTGDGLAAILFTGTEALSRVIAAIFVTGTKALALVGYTWTPHQPYRAVVVAMLVSGPHLRWQPPVGLSHQGGE